MGANIFFVTALVGCLLISFQNCSQSNFTTSSLSSESPIAATSENTDSSDAIAQTDASRLDGLLKRDRVCPAILCTAPPVGCHYEQDASSYNPSSRCLQSCGKLVCEQPEICPMMACAAPPPGCRYNNNPAIAPNGCPIGCGELVCDKNVEPEPPVSEPPAEVAPLPLPTPPVAGNILPIKPEPVRGPICPAIEYICNLPSEGCHYDGQKQLDPKGCPVGCGNLICTRPVPETM